MWSGSVRRISVRQNSNSRSLLPRYQGASSGEESRTGILQPSALRVPGVFFTVCGFFVYGRRIYQHFATRLIPRRTQARGPTIAFSKSGYNVFSTSRPVTWRYQVFWNSYRGAIIYRGNCCSYVQWWRWRRKYIHISPPLLPALQPRYGQPVRIKYDIPGWGGYRRSPAQCSKWQGD